MKRYLILSILVLSQISCNISKPENNKIPTDYPGFYVSGTKIYDGNGAVFKPVGFNTLFLYQDPGGAKTIPGIAKTSANCVRMFWHDSKTVPLSVLDGAIANAIDHQLVVIVGLWDATGKWENLDFCVDYWLRDDVKTMVQKYERYFMLNIANEAGDETIPEADWENRYVEAVKKLRAAGYRVPLVIDPANWGRDERYIINSGEKVLAADPLRNIIFGWHPWDINQPASRYVKAIQSSLDKNLCMIVGEFSHLGANYEGILNWRPLVEECNKKDIGWLPWSWCLINDKHNIVDNFDFDQITEFGAQILYEMDKVAVKASIFHPVTVLPWYKTTYRWAQTNFTEDDPVKADLEFWRKQWRRTKTQGIIINCGGIVAYYPSKFDLQYRAKYLGEQDFFKRVSDAAREEGIVVVARMDINRATKEFYEAHPDWFCRRKNGEPIISQGRYYSCINSDYYKVYIPQVLEEIIERYHPAGFTDNSWKGLERNTICYCHNCKTKFKAERGLELPEAVSWDDPVYREWVRWGYECRIENWDLFNRVTKKAGGDDCLWFGMLHADPASGTFADLKAILSRSKMVFCDHQSRESAGFEQNVVNGALLRLASDEQALAPESMANYVRGNRTFRLATNPKEETRLWMISGIAGGLSPWFHHIGGSQNDSRQFETPVPIFQWHADNEQYLYNRTDLSNVAVVWSQANADFYGRNDVREKVSFPWKGFCQALSRYRIPFLPINVQDIDKYASRINTLILPDIAVMKDEEIDAVCDFVNNGGNIVVTGITATLDDDGQPSGNDKLWRLLGLSLTGETKGVFTSTSSSWEVSAAHNYFRLPDTRHEILKGFENTTILPFGGGIQMVNSTGNLKPLFSYIPPFPIYPPEFAWIPEEEPDTYPLFAGTLPGGGRAVYFAGDVDRCYGRSLLPDHGLLLASAVRWAANDALPLALDGPGHIDCKLYRQENRLIVHLTNLTGANRTGYMDEFVPVGPFTLTLDTQNLKPKSAFMTVQKKKPPVKVQGGKIIVNIDKITDFEMLVMIPE